MGEIETLLGQLRGSGLAGQGLLRLHDLQETALPALLDLAAALKASKRRGERHGSLAGRNIALLFEKASTRTRAAAAVAVADEGGTAQYMAASELHLGKKESVKDTARVLGRLFDGILFRGFAHRTVEELAAHSGVPVWNGLTDAYHPTQALADLLTVQEALGELRGRKLVYIGDGRNNVAHSLMEGCVQAGMDFVNCAPAALAPDPALVTRAQRVAARSGGRVTLCTDPAQAVPGAHVVYTDVWVSMGEEDQQEARLRLLRPYQVNMDLMRRTGRLEEGQAIFLHCLPAFHDHDTEMTRESGALEVTDEVFEAPFSRVFDQAENRMHTIKAMIMASVWR